MRTGKSSRLTVAALAGLLLAQGRNRRDSGLDPDRWRPRPRPNRYLQGLNRSREADRRRRQIERGQLGPANGLVKP